MNKMNSSLPKTGCCTAVLLLLFAGCAVIPDLGEPPLPRVDLTATGDVSAPQAAFPAQGWWKLYDDAQLNSLIIEGLQRSPSVAEAVARVRSAEASATRAGAALLPSLSGDASYNRSRQSYNMGIDPSYLPHGYSDSTKAALNFEYELDFWGKNSNSVAAAVSETEAARLLADQANLIVSTSIAAAYADLAQYYAELETAQKSVTVRGQTVSLFKQRFDQGLENEASVEQAKANHASAEAEVEALTEVINLTKNKLAALVGATPSRAATIGHPAEAHIASAGLPDLMPADLIARRPDVQAQRLKLEAAARRINVARTGFYPNVNLTGYIGQQSLSLETFTHGYSFLAGIGPAIHLPLFEGGKLQGAYRGARADYDTAVAQYEATIVQALREAADAMTSQRALARRTDKTQEALDAAERGYKVASNRYNGGLSTYLEVLRAEDSVLQARRAMADIHARAFTVDVALVKALGGGFTMNNTIDETEE